MFQASSYYEAEDIRRALGANSRGGGYRHGIELSRQTLARWVIQSSEHLQPLVNLMRDRLLASPLIHCDEMRLQVLKEPDRDLASRSWMWVQTGGPPIIR